VTQAHSYDRILAALYAAPARPEMWDVFLKQFGMVSGVNKAALISHDFPGNNHRMLATLGDCVKDDENVRLYENVYCQLDEWTVRFPKRTDTGRVVQGEAIWPGGELLKSTFYNEFLQKIDICRMACVAAAGPPGNFEALSIYRGPSEDEFDREQLAALEAIVPHLQIALYTRRKLLELESRVSDMETALDHLSTALVLVDATAKVLFANRKARVILDCRDGLAICRGELIAQERTARAALRAMLAAAINPGIGRDKSNANATLVSRSAKRPLQMVAIPLRLETSTVPEKAVAAVFITDPEQRPAARPEMLRALFGLTPAETKLATILLDGKSLSEAADGNGVGREIVRSQLKSIFLKTGTRRQSELMALMVGLPAGRTGAA
jgi:DNA-binding CsgD family transcriptional regulator